MRCAVLDLEVDDGWGLDELPVTATDDALCLDAGRAAAGEAPGCLCEVPTEPAAEVAPPEVASEVASEVDDGWGIEELPELPPELSIEVATIVRTPGRVVIYPRSAYTPTQAHRSMRNVQWRRLWSWASSSGQ